MSEILQTEKKSNWKVLGTTETELYIIVSDWNMSETAQTGMCQKLPKQDIFMVYVKYVESFISN